MTWKTLKLRTKTKYKLDKKAKENKKYNKNVSGNCSLYKRENTYVNVSSI